MAVVGGGDSELKFIKSPSNDGDVLGRVPEIGNGMVDVRGGDGGVQRCGGWDVGAERVVGRGGSHG